MRPLLATNIEQSFRRLNDGIPDFNQEFQTFAAADPSFERPFALEGSVTFRPVLYNDHNGVACAQRDYFGFYAFQQAIRSLLLGINHHVAGDVLVADDLYGPAVASYYTAAYHALHTFLALEGRVFLDSPISPIPSRRPAEDLRDRFIALLTRQNKWAFERRPRNHCTKWLEVRQAFPSRPDELPACFHRLFEYMYRGEFRPDTDLMDVIENPEKHRIRLPDRFEEFLTRIAKTRHLSLYASFGSDPHVVEALWNRDAFSSAGIENQALQFGRFAGWLLTHGASGLNQLVGRLDVSPNVKNALFLSVYMPPFDLPQVDRISIQDLKGFVAHIDNWIKSDGVAAAT